MSSLNMLVVWTALLAGGSGADRCLLPVDARTVFGIRPGSTENGEVQAMLGPAPRVVPQEAASLATWCWELVGAQGSQFVIVDSDDFAGPDRVSEIRVTTRRPGGRICLEVPVDVARRLLGSSPIGRRASDLLAGLEGPPVSSGDPRSFESRWTVDKQMPTDPPRTVPYSGRCLLRVETKAGRVLSWQAYWREEG